MNALMNIDECPHLSLSKRSLAASLLPGDGRHPDLEDGGYLTVDHLQPVGVEVLRQLISLTLLSARAPHHIVHQLNTYVPHMPNLIHLTVCAPKWLTTREAPLPIVPTVPLETFTGPELVARAVLCGSPTFVSLTANTALAKPYDAMDCDVEVLLAIAHRLAAARSVKVSFRFSQLTEEFIFILGVEHLPLLVQLHMLHLLARSADPKPAPSEFCRDDEDMSLGRMRALAAWTLHNPDLRAVRFARGCEWAPHAAGGRWGI
ncbi:hypothetical protein FB451DRAFT_1563788 [Mycena latifolia]|nr:hypothetical protein FB451DRAFT_1563788 [Mycena latifolia]